MNVDNWAEAITDLIEALKRTRFEPTTILMHPADYKRFMVRWKTGKMIRRLLKSTNETNHNTR